MNPNHQKVIELWQSGKRKKSIKTLTGFTIKEINDIILKYKQEQYLNQGDDDNMNIFGKKEAPPAPTAPPQYRQDTTTDTLNITAGQTNKQQPTEEQNKVPMFARYDEATYMQLQHNYQMLELQKQLITEIVRLRETIERVSK